MKVARFSLFWVAALLVLRASANAEPTLGPVETVQSIQKALTADPPQLDVFWTSLPTSYQQEIRTLIATFAEKTDADLWNASFRVLRKAAKVAKEKNEFIRENPMFAQVAGGKTATAESAPFFTEQKNWDAMILVVETIATSDISTHEGLKKLDPKKFLATTGTKLAQACIDLAQAAGGQSAQGEFEKFKNGTFTLVSEEDDAAVVKFEVEGEDADEIRLAKVDGKWVLAELANDFSKQFAQAKESMGQLAITAQQKTQCLGLLKAVEGGLDDLLAASTQDAFNTATDRIAQELQVQFAQAAASFAGGLTTPDASAPAKAFDEDSSDDDSDEKSSDE